MPIVDQDEIIRGTDSDALSSRFSCFLKGYLPQDTLLPRFIPLMAHFKLMAIESEFRRFAVARNLRKTFFNLIDIRNGIPTINLASAKFAVLKSPVINRGSWLRTASIDMLIGQFLAQNADEPVQILSLGAGNDTRAFQLIPKHANLRVFELDFEESCKVKKYTILSDPELCKRLGVTPTESVPQNFAEFKSASPALHSDRYHLIPCDLRTLKDHSDCLERFDWSRKTLVLSECCICYMGTEESNELLQFVKNRLQRGVFVVYEPMGGEQRQHSRYGEVMVRNLRTRGIEMPNLMVYNTVEKQRTRFLGFGIGSGSLAVCDMRFVYYNWMAPGELQRIAQLEMLDELEELNLINSHYCLVVGWWGMEMEFAYKRE